MNHYILHGQQLHHPNIQVFLNLQLLHSNTSISIYVFILLDIIYYHIVLYLYIEIIYFYISILRCQPVTHSDLSATLATSVSLCTIFVFPSHPN